MISEMHLSLRALKLRHFNESIFFIVFQNLLLRIKNAHVSRTIGITRIELTMLGIKDIDASESFNALLYLCYHPAEVRPSTRTVLRNCHQL